jgi:hypothetical protein
MQLITLSHDQGWCSNPNSGSWSWFEIVILNSENIIKQNPDGNDLIWTSHHNPISSNQLILQEGAKFGPDHEIWDHLEVGDMLVVRVCAQYGCWQNIAEEGRLEFEEWFEPTLAPRMPRYSHL